MVHLSTIIRLQTIPHINETICLLYTSDAADERSSVDLGGRRIIKKKNIIYITIRRLFYLIVMSKVRMYNIYQ